MKIISWSIKGSGRWGFKTQLKDLLKVHNPAFIVLMDSRFDSNRTQEIIHSFIITNHVGITWEGFSGGLWLLWFDKATFKLEILYTPNIFIHCQIQDNLKKKKKSFLAWKFYLCLSSINSSKALWKEISSFPNKVISRGYYRNLNELSNLNENSLLIKEALLNTPTLINSLTIMFNWYCSSRCSFFIE